MKISKAWWSQSSEIVVEFNRDCQIVPRVELENTNIKAVSIVRANKHSYAEYSSYYIEDDVVYFFISQRSFPNVERNKSYYLCGDFNDWGSAIGQQQWYMQPVFNNGALWYRLSVAVSQLNLKKGVCQFKFASDDGSWLEPNSNAVNLYSDKNGNSNLHLNLSTTGNHLFVVKTSVACQLGEPVRIYFPDYNLRVDVDESVLLSKVYSNAHLGVHLENNKTVFRLFAPRATQVWVAYRDINERNVHLLKAECSDGAVWVAKADSDLRGKVYVYFVDGENYNNTTAFNKSKFVADPYANAMLNSKGECIVKYDFNLPKADNFQPPHWHDLVIVEAHLRDVLANAKAQISSEERLTFSGLEKWLQSPDCYLRKCGANCVELQPIQEFTYEKKSDYEWGYMPVNWSAPASAYGVCPEKASQNDEFASLVKAFHKVGLAVILDVVYNHYGEPNYLELVDKQYYFVTDYHGNLSNCSGCGNDFRASAPMAKRLILDSLKKLVVNYGVDGFRFDLAELLGVDVLVEIERELKKVKPSIILIAEPWSFRGHIAHRLKNTGFASWNDGFREFILQYAKGNGNFDGFKHFVCGSLGSVASFSAQSVNYVESHDDMCLFDRITSRYENPTYEDICRYKIAYAITILSHGIPMVAEGFDIVRTKNGKNNTYKDGYTNRLDYNRGQRFSGVCNWLRSLVKFRLSQNGKALRRDGCDNPMFFKFYKCAYHEGAGAVLFNSNGCDKSCISVFMGFNPLSEDVEMSVANDLDGFIQIADIDSFNENGLLSDYPIENGILKLRPLSMVLMIKQV